MSVHERWNKVLTDLKPIGKTSRNEQQGFNFRSIDAALNEVKPLFAKHGVHVIPITQVADYDSYTTGRGTVMWRCRMTVEWRIYSVDGDSFDAQTIGEGTDSGDKETSKAQTMAFKYLLWPTLAVAENDATDADGHSLEEANTPPPVTTPSELITPAQLSVIADLAEELGKSATSIRTDATRIARRNIKKADDLTTDEAQALIDHWKKDSE